MNDYEMIQNNMITLTPNFAATVLMNTAMANEKPDCLRVAG